MPLTYDLDIAATKFCHGVADGEIPLLLLFSGTVYYQGETGVQVGPVPWSEEAPFRLPVADLARGHGRPLPRLHLRAAVHRAPSTRCPPTGRST